jgi:plasmid stabilization system protein ParE
VVKKIIWTPKAEKSFDIVIEHLEEHWSEREIINYIRKVNTVINHIALFPSSYRETGREDVREALITKQNLLLYRISGNTIYLLYFWDTRRNPLKKPYS